MHLLFFSVDSFISDSGQSDDAIHSRKRSQGDDTECSQYDEETAVKTRLSSSQLGEQTQPGAYRDLSHEDLDSDGPQQRESLDNLELFDFRSDGASSVHDSDAVSLRTDDETGTYTFTPDESVTTQSSILYGTLITGRFTIISTAIILSRLFISTRTTLCCVILAVRLSVCVSVSPSVTSRYFIEKAALIN